MSHKNFTGKTYFKSDDVETLQRQVKYYFEKFRSTFETLKGAELEIEFLRKRLGYEDKY